MGRSQRYTRNLGRTPGYPVPKRGRGRRFVRFAHAREPFGVFSYLDVVRARLGDEGRAELDQLVAWFDEHLREPDSMVPVWRRVAGNASDEDEVAVCWFRASARQHIAQARRMAKLARQAEVPIIERWVDRLPGQICSDDAHQLAVASLWIR